MEMRKIVEGDKVYVIANTSGHPFALRTAIWVLFNSSNQMLTCQDYRRTYIGYLTVDEVELLKPEKKKQWKG